MSSDIIDSSVLIDCLRGHAGAVGWLHAQSAIGRPSTHLIVHAELLAGARDRREQQLIDSFISAFDVAIPDESDSRAALNLFRQYHLSHGVDWPDCQIAATALRSGVGVVTQNTKHFSAFPGLPVARAY